MTLPPIRVLVVDDAVVVRRVLGDLLGATTDFALAGTAANGRLALQRLELGLPDAVILDVEMPELDGLATLREIRKRWPRLPVVMFSTLTERGAATTLEALGAGASDYVTKPTNTASILDAQQQIRDELLPKLRGLCRRPPPLAASPRPVPAPEAAPPAARPRVPLGLGGPAPEVLVVGVSTGGPNALAEVLPALPADLSVPLVIVQHMPPVFTRFLAERLAARCRFPVVEAQDGQAAEAGHAYVAPGDFHVELERAGPALRLRTTKAPPENSCRPAVDVLFRAAAAACGARTLALVLTGMGQDGLRGAEAIRAAGGVVLAQDEATSVVWGMPGYVAQAGLAEQVLPLPAIAEELRRRIPAAHPAGR